MSAMFGYVEEETTTPSTGFVDEQLLPAITIGLVSIIAFVAVANKKKKYSNI